MLIVYRYLISFPNEKAHSIQIAQTIHALARQGAEVHFYPRVYTRPTTGECLAHYGLEPHPNLHLQHLHKWCGHVSGWKRRWADRWERRTFAALAKRKPVFYLRDGEDSFSWLKRTVSKRKAWNAKAILESHRCFSLERDEYSRPDAPDHERRNLAWIAPQGDIEGDGLRACDALTAISESLRDALTETHLNLPDISTVRSGSDPAPETTPTLNEREGVVYAGQLYAWKGVPTVIRAMAELPDQRLTVVGGNKLSDVEAVRELAKSVGVAGRVNLVGHVPHAEVAGHVMAARCAVVPLGNSLLARRFTSPIKIFEYMAAGTPIVAADLPTVREVLHHEENALLFEPENPKSLAEQIQRVMTDDALAEKLREQALRDLDQYTYDARAKQIIELAKRVRDDR